MEVRMVRQTDWNALMRAVLLTGLTIYLFRLALTGQIQLYIHPKFTWFTVSSGVGMLAMAGGQLVRGLRGVTGPVAPLRSRLYLVYTAVICGGFLLQPIYFGSDLAAKQGLNVTNRTAQLKVPGKGAVPAGSSAAQQGAVTDGYGADAATEPTVPGTDNGTGDVAVGSGGAGGSSEGSEGPGSGQAGAPVPQPKETDSAPDPTPVGPRAGEPPQVQLVDNRVVITPQNFWPWMNELYGTPERYAGKQVVMDGFVFYPPDSGPEEFAVTRLVVTCHVAHAYPDGLLALRSGVARPAQDSWFRVEGLLESTSYQGQPTLRIQIQRMTEIAQPTDPYIYP